MERKPYSAGAVKFSFWFMEFRKTVQLLSEGKSFADIKKLNEETNIYGAPTKLRAQQIYSTVTARIKTLGPAMFSRIGCCVEYADLTVEQKQKIVNNWYDSIMASLKDDERVYIETTDIHEWFLKNAERYDNIRILKSKMENAIFEKLTDHFIIMTGSMAEGTQDRV